MTHSSVIRLCRHVAQCVIERSPRSLSPRSLLDVQYLKGLVWREAGKFACCVLRQGTYGIASTFAWLNW